MEVIKAFVTIVLTSVARAIAKKWHKDTNVDLNYTQSFTHKHWIPKYFIKKKDIYIYFNFIALVYIISHSEHDYASNPITKTQNPNTFNDKIKKIILYT